MLIDECWYGLVCLDSSGYSCSGFNYSALKNKKHYIRMKKELYFVRDEKKSPGKFTDPTG